ncbi:MAG: hypothetical protein K2W95_29770 [Candidatus Obscuribacterales bacterium]|nr:hypothetical protein [Candidatus Obscuribacterales bacterium]
MSKPQPRSRKINSRAWRRDPNRPRTRPGEVRSLGRTFSRNTESATRAFFAGVPAPPSIVELARALKHDVDLIYEWVYSNVNFLPCWGSNKGSFGALLDRVAGAIDQSALMVQLLLESGYTAGFLYGAIRLNKAQIEQLLGTDDSTVGTTTENILAASQIPFECLYDGGDLVHVDIEHVWVKVEIDEVEYVFDPSFKTYSYITGSVNVGAAIGFDLEALETVALTGATPGTGFIEGFNVSGVEGEFDTYSADLFDEIKTTAFAANLAGAIGGRTTVPLAGSPVRQTSLPYQMPGTEPVDWEDTIPTSFRATLEVIFDTIAEVLFADEIYGRRLTLTFNGSNQGVLSLDGAALATGTTALTPGDPYEINFSVVHPFADDAMDENWTQMVVAGGTYLIANAWGPCSSSMTDYHRQTLLQNIASGGADDDEDVLGEALSVFWFMRRIQGDLIEAIYDQLGTCQHFWYHAAGIVGYSDTEAAPYFDVVAAAFDVVSREGDTAIEQRIITATELLGNGLEAGVIQQMLPVAGISAMQILRTAATQKIWDVTATNWTTVSAALDPSWDDYKEIFKDQVTDFGSRIIVHEDGATAIDDFEGGGWFEITDAGVVYGFTQGQLTAPMVRARAARPVFCNYDMVQTHFASYNGPFFPLPTCTANNLTTRKTGGGICNAKNPVRIEELPWGAPDCPNIKIEKRTLTPGATFIPDSSDPYPDPPNKNLWQHGKVLLKGPVGNGGSSSKPATRAQTNAQAGKSAGSPKTGDNGPGRAPRGGDPVSLFSGHFVYDRKDITVGSGNFPYSLSFSRRYNSGDCLTDGPLGLGWTHNFETNLAVGSDGLRGCGATSPKEAAAVIAHCYVMLQITDLPNSSLVDFLIASMSTMWLMDKLTNNAVVVNDGEDTRTYIKLPKQLDSMEPAPYNPPPGYADRLIDNENGTFSLRSPQFLTWNFNAEGKLATYVDPAGVTVTYGYDGDGRIETITNGLTRTLTLAYALSGRLESVTDGTRDVTFTVDGSGNLTAFTDAETNTISYDYSSPGLLTELFLPANPTDAFITNEYDSLGRITSQIPSDRGTSNFYFAGSRAEVVDPDGYSQILYFNALGSLLSEINELGQKTIYERDGLNRQTKVTFPEGNSTELVLDPNNNVTSITSKTKPGSSLSDIVIEFEYANDWNKVSLARDGEGNATTFGYDGVPGAGQGTLLTITRPVIDGMTPQIVYNWNARGQVLTRSEKVTQPPDPAPPTFLVDSFVYDEFSEVLLETHRDPDGEDIAVLLGHTAAGDVNSVTDPRGHETTFEFDAERRLTKRIDTASIETQWFYNENGELITIKRKIAEEEFQEWTQQFNVIGDLVTISDPADNELNFLHDQLGRLVSRTDAEGRKWQFAHDPVGRIITVIDPMGETSEARTFTENGNLATITDARNNTTEMEFDGFDRLSKRIYPDAAFEQFGYNRNSQVLTMLTRKGDSITNTFDVLTRLATRDPGALPMQTMAYDLTDRLLSVSTSAVEGDPSSGLFSFGYDTAGRLISQSSPTGEDPPAYREVSYQLDKNGNRVKLIWPDGYFAFYIFDELNRLTDIKLDTVDSEDPAAIQISYDNLSRRVGLSYINGCSATYAFAVNNDLTSLEHAFVGSSVTFAYSFNNVHQVTAQDVSDVEFLWKPTALALTNYAPANNLNQYPAVAGNACSYDDNGNLTSGPFTSAAFDVINRVTQIVSGGTTNNYWNDPLNRQAQKEVDSTKSGFLYDGVQLIAEYNSGGSLVNRYIPGAGLDEILVQIADPSGTPVTTYLHQDRLGSTVAQTGSSGAVLSKCQYSPFGETPSLSGTVFGFTGQRYDAEIKQYNYKSRQYAPGIGRFLQPDPIGYLAGDLNLYGYVGNDPANLVDPLGLDAIHAHVFAWINIPGTGAKVPLGHDILLISNNKGAVTLIEYGRFDRRNPDNGVLKIAEGWGRAKTNDEGHIPVSEIQRLMKRLTQEHSNPLYRKLTDAPFPALMTDYLKNADYDKMLARARELQKQGPTKYGWLGAGKDCKGVMQDITDAGMNVFRN